MRGPACRIVQCRGQGSQTNSTVVSRERQAAGASLNGPRGFFRVQAAITGNSLPLFSAQNSRFTPGFFTFRLSIPSRLRAWWRLGTIPRPGPRILLPHSDLLGQFGYLLPLRVHMVPQIDTTRKGRPEAAALPCRAARLAVLVGENCRRHENTGPARPDAAQARYPHYPQLSPGATA